jgi:hypothetical protein
VPRYFPYSICSLVNEVIYENHTRISAIILPQISFTLKNKYQNNSFQGNATSVGYVHTYITVMGI